MSATTPTAPDPDKAPAGALYRCPDDNLCWAVSDGDTCWFCGQQGQVDHEPTFGVGYDFLRTGTERRAHPHPASTPAPPVTA